jgi:hypothetical protein
LPAHFSWDEPARHGKNADVVARTWHTEFSPNSGVLSSKASMDVQFTFTARRPGRIDALFACDVEGMAYPLGFTLTAMAKGLVVTYEVVGDGVAEDDLLISNEPKVRPTCRWRLGPWVAHVPTNPALASSAARRTARSPEGGAQHKAASHSGFWRGLCHLHPEKGPVSASQPQRHPNHVWFRNALLSERTKAIHCWDCAAATLRLEF